MIEREIIDNRKVSSGPRRGDRLQAIDAEILREKAEALGRAGLRLEEALDDLGRVREAMHMTERRFQMCCGSPEETSSLRATHSDLAARREILRDRARLAYLYLVIQREAVGVRNHLDVERCYRISKRLR